MGKKITIGSFEAKTHLADLLDQAAQGTRFIITKRGRPVAELGPYEGENGASRREDVLAELRRIRQSASGSDSIRELRDEGRKR